MMIYVFLYVNKQYSEPAEAQEMLHKTLHMFCFQSGVVFVINLTFVSHFLVCVPSLGPLIPYEMGHRQHRMLGCQVMVNIQNRVNFQLLDNVNLNMLW